MSYLRTAILLAGLTALFMLIGYLIGGPNGAVIAFFVAAATNFITYWNADKLVLSTQGAQEVDEHSAPDLVHMVAELAQRAELPMPRVFVMDNPQPNAFATGRNPQHGAVAVTTGLLGMLSRDELAGVIAHELAHIKNHDTLLMTVTATVAGAISMLAQFGFWFGGTNNRNNPLGPIGAILMIVLAPLAAGLVQLAISRTREYEADRDGAEISGDPRALATALAKISQLAHRTVNVAAERNPAMAHMYFFNPLSGARMDNLFATHPAVENRIAELEKIAASMQVDSRGRRENVRTARESVSAPSSGWRASSTGRISDDDAPPRGPWG